MSDTIDPFEGLEEIIPEAKPTKSGKKKAKKSDLALLEKAVKEVQVEKPKAKEDVNQKAKLVYAIQNIGKNARFGKYLREQGHRFDDNYLRNLTIKELEFEVEKNNVALGNKSNKGLIDIVIKNGLVMGETVVSNKTQFQIKGTTEILFADDHFLDLLERIKIKHSMPFFDMPPELELALTVAQTALMVHNTNKFSSQLSTHIDLEREVIEE